MRTIIFCFFLISALFIFNENALATGPSYIDVEIKPIAMNKRGEILCKTSFLKNETGSHHLNIYEFGLCVITNDSILEYPIFFLDGDIYEEEGTYDKYIADCDGWHNWLNDSVGIQQTSQEKALIDQFGFDENDLTKYQRSDTISIYDFQRKYNIHFQTTKLKSLKSTKSTDDRALSDSIVVVYDFGNIIITQNGAKSESDNNYDPIGFYFDYEKAYMPDVKYDEFGITGILFLDNAKK